MAVSVEMLREKMTEGLMILLAEDNPDDREHLQRLLENYKGKLDVATTGGEALAKALTDKYDLILLDLLLPQLDGPEILTQLRAKGIKTRVVVITGMSEQAEELYKAVKQYKVVTTLQKPVTQQQIDLMFSLFGS